MLLQGRADSSGIEISIDGQVVTTSGADGTFEVGSVSNGPLKIRASHFGVLDAVGEDLRCRPGQSIEMQEITLSAGEAVVDGSIDLFDLVRIGAHYQTCQGEDGFDDSSDVNESGCVDLFDLVLVGGNYNTAGPIVWNTSGGRYASEIDPIFRRYCRGCHGDRGGVNLESYDHLMAGGDNGPVIVPGDPGGKRSLPKNHRAPRARHAPWRLAREF